MLQHQIVMRFLCLWNHTVKKWDLDTCLEFTSNIDFNRQNQTLASLELVYEHFVNQKMDIRGVNFTAVVPELSYYHYVNYGPFGPYCRLVNISTIELFQ